MLGSAVVRRLASEDCEILTAGREIVDLERQDQVERWVADNRPDAVVLAAARVGGILANQSYPGEFLYKNLMIAANVVEAARRGGVEKLLYVASSAVYPQFAPQPIGEDALLAGPCDPSHEGYATAKIAGLKLVTTYRRQYGVDFIAALPTNLYGPGDNFDPVNSHVVPGLIRKAHEAKETGAPSLTIWGSGAPRRELLHVDDCADALVFLLETYSGDRHVNVGSGEDVTILELAQTICRVVGFDGRIVCDTSKPDGAARRLMSADTLRSMGWKPKIGLTEGMAATYRWFLDNVASAVQA
jgi:GDP-L-fucose synthase